MWSGIAQAKAILIRLCRQQEVGGASGVASQEVADCITGGDRWKEWWKRWIRELSGKHWQTNRGL